MLVDQEELKPGASVPVAMTGVAANLSRKKATPPQPSAKKQLVIKFVKGTSVLQFSSVKLLSGLGTICKFLGCSPRGHIIVVSLWLIPEFPSMLSFMAKDQFVMES